MKNNFDVIELGEDVSHGNRFWTLNSEGRFLGQKVNVIRPDSDSILRLTAFQVLDNVKEEVTLFLVVSSFLQPNSQFCKIHFKFNLVYFKVKLIITASYKH